jgi:hypothetical protein
MSGFNIFRRRKHRKYPITRDKDGKSLRTRCFELFEEGQRPAEVAGDLNARETTVFRYFRDWQHRGPKFDVQYAYARELFKKTNSEREENIKRFAGLCGIEKDQLEDILSQPYGLRRFMTRKFHFPVEEEADNKRSLALELAVVISNHLVNEKGKFSDVYVAIKSWMLQNKDYRERAEREIEDENKAMALIHHILDSSLEAERQGWIKPDRLSPEERNTIVKYVIAHEKKQTEIMYWFRVSGLMAGGLTMEQACEKLYQDTVAKGDLKAAKVMREFQSKLHPQKKNDQAPASSPSTPPATP